jgi:hypothetical protein
MSKQRIDRKQLQTKKIEKQKKKERKTETETGKNRGTTDDDQCVSQFARVGLCTSAPYPQKLKQK